MGSDLFREKYKDLINLGNNSKSVGSLQEGGGSDYSDCNNDLKLRHASVLVKGWTWIPDNLDNLYSCRCELSCLWTKSPVLADKPEALLFETTTPPIQVGLNFNF